MQQQLHSISPLNHVKRPNQNNKTPAKYSPSCSCCDLDSKTLPFYTSGQKREASPSSFFTKLVSSFSSSFALHPLCSVPKAKQDSSSSSMSLLTSGHHFYKGGKRHTKKSDIFFCLVVSKHRRFDDDDCPNTATASSLSKHPRMGMLHPLLSGRIIDLRGYATIGGSSSRSSKNNFVMHRLIYFFRAL